MVYHIIVYITLYHIYIYIHTYTYTYIYIYTHTLMSQTVADELKTVGKTVDVHMDVNCRTGSLQQSSMETTLHSAMR